MAGVIVSGVAVGLGVGESVGDGSGLEVGAETASSVTGDVAALVGSSRPQAAKRAAKIIMIEVRTILKNDVLTGIIVSQQREKVKQGEKHHYPIYGTGGAAGPVEKPVPCTLGYWLGKNLSFSYNWWQPCS
jgi:hypothetical protein